MNTIVISKITETKKGRYALFCGEDFLFSVDEETFTQYHIVEGMPLAETRLEEIRKQSDNRKAVRKALDYLALRDHSRKELRDKLLRKYDAETADYALDRVAEYGYMDDEKFAARYAEELMVKKGLSLRETQNRLWRKGIDRERIARVLLRYEQDETDQIIALIEKKYRAKVVSGKEKSVYETLIRKGFSSGDVRRALRKFQIEVDEEYGYG
jgi:regulatory protein